MCEWNLKDIVDNTDKSGYSKHNFTHNYETSRKCNMLVILYNSKVIINNTKKFYIWKYMPHNL